MYHLSNIDNPFPTKPKAPKPPHTLDIPPEFLVSVDNQEFSAAIIIKERLAFQKDLELLGIRWQNYSLERDGNDFYIYAIEPKYYNIVYALSSSYPSLHMFNEKRELLGLRACRGKYDKGIHYE